MGTPGSLTNTQLLMPEDAGMGIATPKYSCSGHEDPRLIDKYRLVIIKTPDLHSGTREVQLLSAQDSPDVCVWQGDRKENVKYRPSVEK